MRRKRDGRCKHDEQTKGELIRKYFKPGVSITRLAIDHGTNANLVMIWIPQYQRECKVEPCWRGLRMNWPARLTPR
nr:transposase [Paraburkholderia hospita]